MNPCFRKCAKDGCNAVVMAKGKHLYCSPHRKIAASGNKQGARLPGSGYKGRSGR